MNRQFGWMRGMRGPIHVSKLTVAIRSSLPRDRVYAVCGARIVHPYGGNGATRVYGDFCQNCMADRWAFSAVDRLVRAHAASERTTEWIRRHE